MQDISAYTSIFAPAVFFVFGIIAVVMLNKFIGARPEQKKGE